MVGVLVLGGRDYSDAGMEPSIDRPLDRPFMDRILDRPVQSSDEIESIDTDWTR